jgi:DNA-binding MarR family transcriptional regulator
MGVLFTLRTGAISQQALGAALNAHPTQLVALLNDLEAGGLIVRRRDPDDRRRHTVSLSELGRARMAAVDIAREKLEAQLFAGVSPARRALLVALLTTIADNLGISPCNEASTDEAS